MINEGIEYILRKTKYGRPVVISTNLDYAALMEQYSDRVMSRLIGEYTVMKCFGEDIRMKKKFAR